MVKVRYNDRRNDPYTGNSFENKNTVGGLIIARFAKSMFVKMDTVPFR
jgi:hypothetical protein